MELAHVDAHYLVGTDADDGAWDSNQHYTEKVYVGLWVSRIHAPYLSVRVLNQTATSPRQ